jgi:hypothetical protein
VKLVNYSINVMDEEIIYLLNRFQRHKKLLVDLYSNDDAFKSLSQNYYNTAITLEKYEHNITKGSKGRQEHERIFSDLENSIIRYLKTHNDVKNKGEKTSRPNNY